MCNDTEEYEKFEEELTCRFKSDIKNLMNFDTCAFESLKCLHFTGLLLTRVYNV